MAFSKSLVLVLSFASILDRHQKVAIKRNKEQDIAMQSKLANLYFSFLFCPVYSCLRRAYIITHRSLNVFSCLMQRRKPKLVEKKATTLFKLVNNRHATCSKWKRRRFFVKILSFIKSTLALCVFLSWKFIHHYNKELS